MNKTKLTQVIRAALDDLSIDKTVNNTGISEVLAGRIADAVIPLPESKERIVKVYRPFISGTSRGPLYLTNHGRLFTRTVERDSGEHVSWDEIPSPV